MSIFNRISDKAVQVALDEYKGAIEEGISEWFAMRLAMDAAMEKQKKTSFMADPSKRDMEFSVLLLGVSLAAFFAGVLAKWFM